MSDLTGKRSANDEATEHALREGLKPNALSAEAMHRIRQAAQKEWQQSIRTPERRTPRVFAVAASIVVLAAASIWAFQVFSPGTNAGEVFGQVAAVDPPGLVEQVRFARDSRVDAGSSIHVGQRLEAHGDTLVNLATGGNLRVARTSAFEIQASETVTLTAGELYVDIPPGTHAASSFRVVTSAGEFRHVGTQFSVMISGGQTRLRVREGEVVWRAAAGDSTIAAGTEVTIDGQRNSTQRQLSTAGRDWAWTEAMAPEVAIDNRPLIEFLQWYARETGRRLDIDDHSRQQAAGILMHGSVRGLTVTEALSAVMATTTSLKYELPEGLIRVSSTRDPKPARL